MPREKVLLVNVAGVRLIITADTTLVFEPSNPSSQRYIQARGHGGSGAAATLQLSFAVLC